MDEHDPDPRRDGDDAPADRAGAAARLREAMALHSAGRIDEALEAAAEAATLDPQLRAARAYRGNTLVTRKRRFADGIAELEAAAAGSDDPAIWYTLGWCREFAANALRRPTRAHQPLADDADTLYREARAAMLHALTLSPEPGLRGDIEDILDVIAGATGWEWEQEAARAADSGAEAAAADPPPTGDPGG